MAIGDFAEIWNFSVTFSRALLSETDGGGPACRQFTGGAWTHVVRKLEAVGGIGPVYAQKLAVAGMKLDTALLKKAASAKGRTHLAEQTGISAAVILKWVNRVDLMRVTGIGPQFAELLEAAGVDTVKKLSQRNAANLAATVAEVRQAKRLSGKPPSVAMVSKWIAGARRVALRITCQRFIQDTKGT